MFAFPVAKAGAQPDANSGRFLGRPSVSAFAHNIEGAVDQTREADREGLPNASWDFTKIPVFPPRDVPQPEARAPLTTASPSTSHARLAVGEVDDPLEYEAERVADQAMRGLGPISVATAPPSVSRKCASCEEEDAQALQPKRASSAKANATLDAGAAARAVELGGEPLPGALRSYFEPRFGHDFSRVRIHADAEAAAGARAVQARAYTLGRSIVFGSGEYAPATEAGKRLIAHELAHVLQQRGGSRLSSSAAGVIQRQPDPRVHPSSTAGSAPAVPYEKWSPDVEAAYRRAGLVKPANAVRLCREEGFCSKVLTEAEAWQMYGSGRITAGLGAPTKEAGAPLLAGVVAAPALQGGAAAQSAAAKTALERAAASWGESAVYSGSTAAPEVAAGAAPEIAAGAAPEIAAGAAPEIAAGAAPGAGVVTIAVPVAIAGSSSWSRSHP